LTNYLFAEKNKYRLIALYITTVIDHMIYIRLWQPYFAGLFIDGGLGIIFRYGGTTGGVDIIATRKWNGE